MTDKRIKNNILSAALLTAVLALVGCAAASQPATAETALPKLKIGTSLDAPYFYMGEDGSYIGIDKEIADEACRRMGYESEYVLFTWGEEDDLLAAGTIDCIWECFAMNGREDMYHWAGPYLSDDETVVVAADSDIYTVDDLAGRTIAVRISSKGEDYFLKEHGTAILSDADTNLCTFDNMTDAFSYFGKGYADAVVGHRMALRSFIAHDPALYRFMEEPLMQLNMGVAFAKDGDAAQADKLQATLDEMKADGTIAAIAAAYDMDTEKAGAAGER